MPNASSLFFRDWLFIGIRLSVIGRGCQWLPMAALVGVCHCAPVWLCVGQETPRSHQAGKKYRLHATKIQRILGLCSLLMSRHTWLYGKIRLTEHGCSASPAQTLAGSEELNCTSQGTRGGLTFNFTASNARRPIPPGSFSICFRTFSSAPELCHTCRIITYQQKTATDPLLLRCAAEAVVAPVSIVITPPQQP